MTRWVSEDRVADAHAWPAHDAHAQEAEVIPDGVILQPVPVLAKHDHDAQRKPEGVHGEHDDTEGSVRPPLRREALNRHVAGQVPVIFHLRASEHATQLDADACVCQTHTAHGAYALRENALVGCLTPTKKHAPG